MKRLILFLVMSFNNSNAYGTAILSPAAISDVMEFVKFANVVAPDAIQPFKQPIFDMRDYCDANKNARVIDAILLGKQINNMDQLIESADQNIPSQSQISLALKFKANTIVDRKSVRTNFLSYLDMVRDSIAAKSFDQCDSLLSQLESN